MPCRGRCASSRKSRPAPSPHLRPWSRTGVVPQPGRKAPAEDVEVISEWLQTCDRKHTSFKACLWPEDECANTNLPLFSIKTLMSRLMASAERREVVRKVLWVVHGALPFIYSKNCSRTNPGLARMTHLTTSKLMCRRMAWRTFSKNLVKAWPVTSTEFPVLRVSNKR